MRIFPYPWVHLLSAKLTSCSLKFLRCQNLTELGSYTKWNICDSRLSQACFLSGMGRFLLTMHTFKPFKHCAAKLYSYWSMVTMLVFIDWQTIFHVPLALCLEMLTLIITVQVSYATFLTSLLNRSNNSRFTIENIVCGLLNSKNLEYELILVVSK